MVTHPTETMSDPLPDRLDDAANCTTTASFDDHEIEDGMALITGTYARLQGFDIAYEPAEWFYEALEIAFTAAYLEMTDESTLPSHVAAAIEDARYFIATEFDEQPEASLRNEVIPTFYRQVAGFHCIYRQSSVPR